MDFEQLSLRGLEISHLNLKPSAPSKSLCTSNDGKTKEEESL